MNFSFLVFIPIQLIVVTIFLLGSTFMRESCLMRRSTEILMRGHLPPMTPMTTPLQCGFGLILYIYNLLIDIN